jgi:hypothetical protein
MILRAYRWVLAIDEFPAGAFGIWRAGIRGHLARRRGTERQ